MTPSPATLPPTELDIDQLSPVARWQLALQALGRIVANPEATDQVLEFSTYANAGSMHRRLHRFYDHPAGQRLFREQRAIDSHTIDLDALAALPPGTLGHAYAHFLRSRGLTPDVFDGPPANVRDPRTAYVVQRMRQTHDLWHVVTGHDTDPAGEIALQAFTFGQVRAPSTLILSLVGTLKGLREKPGLPLDVLAAFRAGRAAQPLIAFPWEDHWATPVREVRAMLGLAIAPVPTKHQRAAA